MTLGLRVKERRLELRLTQKKLADEAGVTQQSIVQIETGRIVNPKNILELAKALKTTPEYLKTGKGSEDSIIIDKNKVPLLSSIQASTWDFKSPEFLSNTEYLLTDSSSSENSFALKIEGDSMFPEFQPGDVVIIDPRISPAPGEFVVARNNKNEVFFRKYRPLTINNDGPDSFELTPLNSDYPTLTSNNNINVIGTMIEHRIYRRKR